jgi:rhodanese-related sulfurtransferase
MVLLAENPESLKEARLRLARVGREDVAGALDMNRWIADGRPVQTLEQVSGEQLYSRLRAGLGGTTLIDVREPSERLSGSIAGSLSIPLPELQWRMGEIDPDTTVIVHCKGGYRSSIAASLLEAGGFKTVLDLEGGYDAWQREATASHEG